jgi:hypothetical protein
MTESLKNSLAAVKAVVGASEIERGKDSNKKEVVMRKQTNRIKSMRNKIKMKELSVLLCREHLQKTKTIQQYQNKGSSNYQHEGGGEV